MVNNDAVALLLASAKSSLAMRRPGKRKVPVQLGFVFRTHGGDRRGVGRRPKRPRAEVSQPKRQVVSWRTPVQVGLRLRPEIWHPGRALLPPDPTSVHLLRRATRLPAHSLLRPKNNHIHLILAARAAGDLVRATQSVSIRSAQGMNRVMERCGRVFEDR